MTSSANTVHIVGGGLAGSEAAWQLASAGVPVVLHEMRPVRGTEAHLTENLAELVCSNSFRSDDAINNAVGLLHEEMRRAGSLIMRAADSHKLPAGGALAVDRHGFSAAVQQALLAHPLVELRREEVAGLPPDDWDSVIVATGPLTSPALAEAIRSLSGEESLAFFDAIAPIVHYESIDRSIAWKQSRYDKGGPAGDGADYLNCPLGKDEYDAFVAALLAGDKTEFKEWEHNTPYFNGCQPIEVIAASGPQTLRFGPMKPVGLRDPRTGHRPWAVVQLRQDNALGTLWNIVGFQTKLKHGEQTRLFRTIPGLHNAEFARLGGLHRNTFLNSPRLLDGTLAAEGDAAAALRRPDHRLRRLCRKRRRRAHDRQVRRRRAAGSCADRAAGDDGDGRLVGPHHRRRGRGDLPADERQFRPVPADRRRLPRQGAQAGAQRARLARFRPVDCPDAARRGVIAAAVMPALASPVIRGRWPAGPEGESRGRGPCNFRSEILGDRLCGLPPPPPSGAPPP